MLNIQVENLIKIHNMLIKHQEDIWPDYENDQYNDYLCILKNELGNKEIDVKKISESVRMQRLVLELNTKIFLQTHEILKCKDCAAPISRMMMDEDEFDEKFEQVSQKININDPLDIDLHKKYSHIKPFERICDTPLDNQFQKFLVLCENIKVQESINAHISDLISHLQKKAGDNTVSLQELKDFQSNQEKMCESFVKSKAKHNN